MKKRGFTLIELLMVSAILSLLMSVVFFRVTEAKKKGEDAHMKAESAEVAKAVYQYKDDHGGKVPGAISVTGPSTSVEGSVDSGDDFTTAMQELVDGGYLSEIPYSPAGNDYSYTISADGLEAVFAADLNYEYISEEDEGYWNSCELTSTGGGGGGSVDPIYPTDYGNYNFGGCTGYQAPTGGCGYSAFGHYQMTDTTSCFHVFDETLPDQCDCDEEYQGFGWQMTIELINEGYFPMQICQNHSRLQDGGYNPYTDTEIYDDCYVDPDIQPQGMYYICSHDAVPPTNQAEIDAAGDDEGVCDGSSNTDYCTCM